MMTDGPKYKRPTVDGYYGLTNLSRIGVGYYVARLIKLKRFSSNGGGTIQNLFIVRLDTRSVQVRWKVMDVG